MIKENEPTSKKKPHNSIIEAPNRKHRRSRSSRSGTPEDEEPLPKHLKKSRQDEDDAVDDDATTDREGGPVRTRPWYPVRYAITAQNSDVEDGERCEKEIDSSHKVTKRIKVLTTSQRQSNMEPDNDAEDENYEVSSKMRREEGSSKKRDEKLNREKPEHSSSRKDRGRRAGSRHKSPTDEEDDEQEKENSDNQELNGYRRDEYKEEADELRKRSKNIRVLTPEEINAKVGLEPLKISSNESGGKTDGGLQKEEAENQYDEQLLKVAPQSPSDAREKRSRTFCKEGGTKNEGGAQKVDIILDYIILHYIMLYY